MTIVVLEALELVVDVSVVVVMGCVRMVAMVTEVMESVVMVISPLVLVGVVVSVAMVQCWMVMM